MSQHWRYLFDTSWGCSSEAVTYSAWDLLLHYGCWKLCTGKLPQQLYIAVGISHTKASLRKTVDLTSQLHSNVWCKQLWWPKDATSFKILFMNYEFEKVILTFLNQWHAFLVSEVKCSINVCKKNIMHGNTSGFFIVLWV